MAEYLPLPIMTKNNGPNMGGAAGGRDKDCYTAESLLHAAKEGDTTKVNHVLKQLPKCINTVFKRPEYCTALHKAVRCNKAEVVRLLLKNQADPNIRDGRGFSYCPIHYAVHIGNVEIIKELMENGADPNIKEMEYNHTPLHIIASRYEKSEEEKCNKCLDVLLSYERTCVDLKDKRRKSPLMLAVHNGWEYMVTKLIYKGANVKPAESDINEKFPDLLKTLDQSKIRYVPNFAEDLYDALKSRNIELFREILQQIDDSDQRNEKASFLDKCHGEYTLLQEASDKGMIEFVEELLNNGADPLLEHHTNGLSPLLNAVGQGYHEIVKLLLAKLEKCGQLSKGFKQVDERKENVMHKVVKREYIEDTTSEVERNYNECFMILLEKNESAFLDLNDQDSNGNTPLHYAVQFSDQSFARDLLLNGANLGIKNIFGILAVKRMQASVLEEVLNESISTTGKRIDDKNYEIILKYRMLAPVEAMQTNTPETESLKYLSSSCKFEHLLQHPIIDSFLCLKWHRIKWYFYINILAYTVFLILLTSYILHYHSTYIPTPPVNGTEVSNEGGGATNGSAESASMGLGRMAWIGSISVFLVYMALREAVQCYISWTLYIKRLKNHLQVSIVVLSVVLLYIPMEPAVQQSVGAWLVLFVWIEFFLVLGYDPRLALYATMLTTVSWNFFRFIFICLFFIVLLGFCFSFYLLFRVNEDAQVNKEFATFHHTILKTVVMTTGEFEYTSLPMTTFPGASHLLFLVFVFFIVLVLMNLLNGLAVSDIQRIQQEAKTVTYRSRVELIVYFEELFLILVYPQPLLHGWGGCCEARTEEGKPVNSNNQGPLISRLLYKLFGRHIMMFHWCLRNHRVQLYPNRDPRNPQREGKRWHVCECHSYDLEEKHIEAAKDIIQTKKQADVAQRLTKLENHMQTTIGQVMQTLQMINLKLDPKSPPLPERSMTPVSS